MAEVVNPSRHTAFAGSIDSMTSANGLIITMERTPDFCFPARSQSSDNHVNRRPASASMHIDIPRSESTNLHRRTASTLPSFSFNAADSSGRQDDESPPRTPDENSTMAQTQRGHRRGGSEFVGGDSRLGVANAVSSSPTKTSLMMEAPPSVATAGHTRRGHAHRRSAAISNHDIGSLMQPPAQVQPRLSSSLPSTPLDHSMVSTSNDKTASLVRPENEDADSFDDALENPIARPPSRPRVGFSDNVEFIPRPLSTISSETESSVSTLRGHSVNNSISSVLSIGASSPPSVRMQRIPPSEVASHSSASPLMGGRRVEREGHWLRRQSNESLKRPVSESAAMHPKTTFVEPDVILRPRKRAVSHALGFDRRKSEPAMCASANESSRLSTLSLQEDGSLDRSRSDLHDFDLRGSAQKIKDWATSKITKRSRALRTSSSTSSIRPVSVGSMSSAQDVEELPVPVAETDLDTVFSQGTTGESYASKVPAPSRFGMEMPLPSPKTFTRAFDSDGSDSMLDLDAALGPFNTPPLGSHRSRKELHSSRLVKDFGGPGGHYHRRSESAPALQPFDDAKESRRSPPDMADVFEEDEEDEDANDAGNVPVDEIWTRLPKRNREAIGVTHGINTCVRNDLGPVDPGDVEQSDPDGRARSVHLLSYGKTGSTPSGMTFDGRASSIVEDTIPEEDSQSDEVEIVEAHDEPRVSSQTKSSDSSDAPTIHAPQLGISTVADGHQSLMTPETYQTSAFSSPALRPGSFDTNRLDTAASSIADNRTISSYATGEHGNELRVSVDVPSLTSSRSTMISSVPGNLSRRELNSTERTMSVVSENVDLDIVNDRQRKRGSIQSLSQLFPGSFTGKPRTPSDARPQTSGAAQATKAPKKEHRLKKLMFWKSKRNSTQPPQPRP